LLAGALGAGAMMAIMMSNAGGAWDNGKKLCEKLNIKKTDQGKACIVGDTVGDPFKDTSGPALNILIKLMSMVSLVLAPLIRTDPSECGLIDGMCLAPCVSGAFDPAEPLAILTCTQRDGTWPDTFYWGFLPLGLFIIVTALLVHFKILTWDDPLESVVSAGETKDGEAVPAAGGEESPAQGEAQEGAEKEEEVKLDPDAPRPAATKNTRPKGAATPPSNQA